MEEEAAVLHQQRLQFHGYSHHDAVLLRRFCSPARDSGHTDGPVCADYGTYSSAGIYADRFERHVLWCADQHRAGRGGAVSVVDAAEYQAEAELYFSGN